MAAFLVLTFFGMAYAWGMRGTILGGEKGAMLPGAVLGVLLARFSGLAVLYENWYVLASVGAAGFYLGGSMTYGQTLGMTMNGPRTAGFTRGMIGVFIKGFVWFGVAAGVLGLTVRVMTGSLYSPTELLHILLACIPAYILGVLLLNRVAKTAIFLYFSETRKESWGGNLLVLLVLFSAAAGKRDLFLLGMLLFGALSGAFAWVFGQLLHVYSKLPLKSGRLLFGQAQKNGFIGGWKLMECLLGAGGGLGIAVGFLVCRRFLSPEQSGILLPCAEKDIFVSLLWTGVFLVNALHIFIEPVMDPRKAESRRKRDTLREDEYALALEMCGQKQLLAPYRKNLFALSEGIDYVLFCYFPVFAAWFGAYTVCRLTAVFGLFWVLTDEICFDQFVFRKDRTVFRVCMVSISAALLLAVWLRPDILPVWSTGFIYFFAYELLQLLDEFRPFRMRQLKEKTGSLPKALLACRDRFLLHIFYIAACTVLQTAWFIL